MSRGTAHKLYHGQSEGLAFDVLDRVCSFLDVQVSDVLVHAPEGSGAEEVEEARREQRKGHNRLLDTLEALLALEATELKGALDEASDLVAAAIGAGTAEAFLHDPSVDTLVVAGSSSTPLARLRGELGLDRLPVANGGRTVEVFRTGEPFLTGCAERDPQIPEGFVRRLGVRSLVAVPLAAGGTRRGVLQAISTDADAFTKEEVEFLEAVARWVGMLVHRAELVDRIAREAAKQARRAAVDEIVVALAHDLGDHLSPLRSRIESLVRRARRGDGPGVLGDAEAAGVELGRLRGLLADLLELGRLGEEAAALRTEAADLAALARDAAAALDAREVRVSAPEAVGVDADPRRLREALADLLAAVADATPDGVPIAVEVASRPSWDGRWAEVVVRDEQPNAPAAVGPVATPTAAPAGLGLYVARAIAEAHGGELTADSGPGPGATFRLALPVA